MHIPKNGISFHFAINNVTLKMCLAKIYWQQYKWTMYMWRDLYYIGRNFPNTPIVYRHLNQMRRECVLSNYLDV